MKIMMGAKKKIALIAHDNMKEEMIQWSRENKDALENHELCGTGTTAGLLRDRVGLDIYQFKSGPFGGDLQIGAKISEGELDMVIFFYDPLMAQPHDPDIKALLRVAALYDIPIAINRSTACFLITSKFIHTEFEKNALDMDELKRKRREEFADLR